jgi:prophage regulatory protein
MERIQIIRLPAVCALTGLSASTIYRLDRAGSFPPRRQLSANAVGWLLSEVETWIATREATVLQPHLPLSAR